MERENISILWDIENVTPSIGSLFLDGLLDYVKQIGNIASALAIGDWKGKLSNSLAVDLSESGFELIHLPQSDEKEKRKKNSSDFVLVTKATEMIFQYPHIVTYILLTGDIDFRPLLQILKKHGKRIIIICDSNNASEHLLEFADEYMDYRNLIPSTDDNGAQDTKVEVIREMPKEEAFPLLAEAVKVMKDKKLIPTSGSVKVRMQLLNENFSGKVLGFSHWNEFVKEAIKQGVVKIDDQSGQGIALSLPTLTKKSNPNSNIPKIIQLLVDALKEISPDKKWISFSQVNNALIDRKILIKNYHYSNFKQLIIDAEKRNLVEMKNQSLIWRVRLK